MMKTSSGGNILLVCGSLVTLLFGLLAALVPGLAYVTVSSYFQNVPQSAFNLPLVHYPTLELSIHPFTLKLAAAALGGLIGLSAFFMAKGKGFRSGFVAVAVAASNLGLMLPATWNMRITIPEYRLFDVLWLGYFLALVGVCLMFLALATKNHNVPRISLLSIPVLLLINAVTPVFVLTNYLPWIIFGDSFGFVNVLLVLMGFSAQLLMIWGAYKATIQHPPTESLRGKCTNPANQLASANQKQKLVAF